MNKIIQFFALLSFILMCNITFAQTKVDWDLLGNVQFEKKYSEELGFTANEATFEEGILQLDGIEIVITGYMIPMDALGINYVVSKHPNASCFFCGKAGPETVIELIFKPSAMRRFKTDERLTLKGKLKLNKINDLHLTYMMEGVEVF